MSGVKGATHVYVCTTRYGVKIGASGCVEKRAKGLPAATLVRSWHLPENAQLVEYHAIRLVGRPASKGWEYFDVTVDDAISAVERAIVFVASGDAPESGRTIARKRREARDRAWARRCQEFREYCAQYESGPALPASVSGRSC